MSGYLHARRRESPAADWEAAPDEPAVFLVWAAQGQPYLARTGLLKRRLGRLLRSRERMSAVLNLGGVAERIEWYPTASRLESSWVLYTLARRYYPAEYARLLKLGRSAYVKITLSNQFPRTAVTTRITGGSGRFFGPFRSRAAAEAFEAGVLELFQVRRCQEDILPRADHPGCIYGEMNMCLRPCQRVVGPEEYASEVARLGHFLESSGMSLLEPAMAARDRLSAEMEFEDAARQHKLVQKIEEVLKLRDELARDLGRLFGVAVTPAREDETVLLWFLDRGWWHDPLPFSLAVEGGRPVSLDHRLREAIASLPACSGSAVERADHLGLLARWYYSRWRDGEWIAAESAARLPFRRLVGAVARVARRATSYS